MPIGEFTFAYHRYIFPSPTGLESVLSIVLSLLAVVVCGTFGGVAAWALVTSIGLGGVSGSLLAAVVGMVIAVGAWIGGTALLHRLSGRH